jgi:hypothetical protein
VDGESRPPQVTGAALPVVAVSGLAGRVIVDPPLPNVFTRAVATGAGLTRNQVEQRLANARWRRLTRGAFCETSRWQQASPAQRHLLIARAVLLTRNEPGDQALSHITAVILHGLPVSAHLLGQVWMTGSAAQPRSTRYTPLLRREVAPLPPPDLTLRAGLPVTSLARTVADCLRHLPLIESVPLADAALQTAVREPDLLTRPYLDEVVGRQSSWPYAQAAQRAPRLATHVVSPCSSLVRESSCTPTACPPRHRRP